MTDSASTTLAAVRRFLLAILALGFAGTTAELLLAEHTEDAWQWVPLVLLVLGLALMVPAAARPGRATLGAFRALMLLFVVSGAVGSFLHYRAKTEFALERLPDLRGLALVREAIKGSSPPILAPGAMIALGLLGLTWTYRLTDTMGDTR